MKCGTAALEQPSCPTPTPVTIIVIIITVAVESLGPINASGRVFLSKLGRKLAERRQRNQLLISATLRSDSPIKCHLTA